MALFVAMDLHVDHLFAIIRSVVGANRHPRKSAAQSIVSNIAKKSSRSMEEYERDRDGKVVEKGGGKSRHLPGHNCCDEEQPPVALLFHHNGDTTTNPYTNRPQLLNTGIPH